MILIGVTLVAGGGRGEGLRAGGGEGIAAASSRESTPDSDISTSSLVPKNAAGLPAANWDPAKQLLLLMGMEPLLMMPGWEFASTVRLKPACITSIDPKQASRWSFAKLVPTYTNQDRDVALLTPPCPCHDTVGLDQPSSKT